ncbi:restriction endonuclease subunit S [Nocardia asiatica]|uniref:restriction endonuclease subunit S n=1 Tax=Nocardia asiatica TaxID=209252 RepID=UPI002454DCFE|nr:restriction endonuclease subunit S [Nocardia asiatica]
MNWPVYAAYVDSGVKWIDSVPISWKVGQLKRWIERIESGTSVNAADIPAGEAEIGVLKTSCVYSGEFNIGENKTVLPEELGRVSCPVTKGTLIVSRMNTPDLVGAAGYVSSSHPGIFLPDRLWQVYFHGLDARWVSYWSKTKIYRDQLKSISVGTSSSMQNISQSDFGSIIIPAPSEVEQSTIISFLDRETAKIDALIAKQEQLIDTLREDRAATITQAVTKGLNPDVEMKWAGVDWVDRVPSGWIVTPFLRCMQGRVDYRGATPKKVDNGIVLITARNVRPGFIDYNASKEFVSPEEYSDVMRRGTPEIDDLLFTMEAPLGYVALVDRIDIALAQRIIKFRADRSVADPRFLMYSIMSGGFQSQLTARATGSTALGLKASKLHELRIALPSLCEQRRITRFLDDRCAKIDALIAKSTEMIDTLSEYRSALITDAVTGKIDVRSFVAEDAGVVAAQGEAK